MPPSTDWQEVIPAGEADQLLKLAESLRDLQRKRAKGKVTLRGLHAKGIGVEAELNVFGDLPDYAKVGVFQRPARYRAYARFSNGAGVPGGDAKPDVRGAAIKIVGVDGKKVIPGLENARTQDFLFIRNRRVPFRDAEEFVTVVLATANPLLALPRLVARLGVRRAASLVRELSKNLSAPMPSIATTTYFSALPLRWGAHAAKVALRPRAPSASTASDRSSPRYLAQELGQRLSSGPLTWEFQAQFYVDPVRTPIEDPRVDWEDRVSPFVTLGELTVLRQDLEGPRGQRIANFVEGLSFDPWHAVEEMRPLGNMMRARNVAYRLSTEARGAAPEPDGSERFD